MSEAPTPPPPPQPHQPSLRRAITVATVSGLITVAVVAIALKVAKVLSTLSVLDVFVYIVLPACVVGSLVGSGLILHNLIKLDQLGVKYTDLVAEELAADVARHEARLTALEKKAESGGWQPDENTRRAIEEFVKRQRQDPPTPSPDA